MGSSENPEAGLMETNNPPTDASAFLDTREKIADTTNRTHNKPEKVRTILESLSGGRYLSTEAMNEALRGLSGVKAEIPADEIARLAALFPKKLPAEIPGHIRALKDCTEGNRGPFIMQLPSKIVLDGKETPFNIATMKAIMERSAVTNGKIRSIWFQEDLIPEDIIQKTPDGLLTAWTSTSIKGSHNSNYIRQLAIQSKIFGTRHTDHVSAEKPETAKYGVHPDMILAMAMHYIASRNGFVSRDEMRLNALDTDGDPIAVIIANNRLNLYPTDKSPHMGSGIGASLKIKD